MHNLRVIAITHHQLDTLCGQVNFSGIHCRQSIAKCFIVQCSVYCICSNICRSKTPADKCQRPLIKIFGSMVKK
jgi:hypothetical protein